MKLLLNGKEIKSYDISSKNNEIHINFITKDNAYRTVISELISMLMEVKSRDFISFNNFVFKANGFSLDITKYIKQLKCIEGGNFLDPNNSNSKR